MLLDNISRFWLNVDKRDEHWLWTGPVNGSGYPTFNVRDDYTKRYVQQPASRYVYKLHRGIEVSGKRHLWPTCGHRLCVNPDCQEILSHSQVMRRVAASRIEPPQRVRAT